MSSDEKVYPHEQPLPDNVELHPNRHHMDLPVTDVLRTAFHADLHEVVIVGIRKTGAEFLATSMADTATAMYYLSRANHVLNMMIDEN